MIISVCNLIIPSKFYEVLTIKLKAFDMKQHMFRSSSVPLSESPEEFENDKIEAKESFMEVSTELLESSM